MIADFGLSETQFGWVLAAFTAGYTIFQFPGGLLQLAVGVRRALTWIMIGWAVFTMLTAIVPAANGSNTLAILTLVCVRFLVGALHAPIYPVGNAAIERWFPVSGRGLPQGLLSTGLTLGIAATTPIVAAGVANYGWRVTFLMMAPFGLVMAAFFWRMFRDDPESHPAVNQQELELIASDQPDSAPPLDDSRG